MVARIEAAPLQPRHGPHAVAILTILAEGRGRNPPRAGGRRAFPRDRRLGFADGRRRGRQHRRGARGRGLERSRRCRAAAASCAPRHGTAAGAGARDGRDPRGLRAGATTASRASASRRPARRSCGISSAAGNGAAAVARARPAPVPARAHLPGMPNILRALVFEEARPIPGDTGRRAQFEIDDMTGEEIGVAADRLRALDGVLDVRSPPRRQEGPAGRRVPPAGAPGRGPRRLPSAASPRPRPSACAARGAAPGAAARTAERGGRHRRSRP